MPTVVTLQIATLLSMIVALVGGGLFFGKIIQWQKDHDFRHKTFDKNHEKVHDVHEKSQEASIRSMHHRINELKGAK